MLWNKKDSCVCCDKNSQAKLAIDGKPHINVTLCSNCYGNKYMKDLAITFLYAIWENS